MGLAQAHAAVDEKGVIFRADALDDRQRGGVDQLVGGANHIRGESVARIEVCFLVNLHFLENKLLLV